MPEEPKYETNGDEVAVSSLIDWLTGSAGSAPEIEASWEGKAVAQALRNLFGRDLRRWHGVLRRVAELSGGESLLESILSNCWEDIRDSFRVGLSYWAHGESYSHEQISNGLIYLVLSLIPNMAEYLRDLNLEELRFLVQASRYDPDLQRILLTWASGEPQDNKRRWSVEDDHTPPTSTWGFAAQLILKTQATRIKVAYTILDFYWNSDIGVSLARRMVARLAPESLLREGSNFFRTNLDFLAELGKLSIESARRLGIDPRFAHELVEETSKIDITLSPSSNLVSRLTPKIYAALPFISMENLEKQSLRVGWIIASQLEIGDLPRTRDSVAQILQRSQSEVEHTKLCGVAFLWADLRQLARYHSDGWKHGQEIRGVHARLSRHLESWPEAWVVSAREILRQDTLLEKDGSDLLTLAAAQQLTLRNVLRELAEHDSEGTIRDKSSGLLAHVEGFSAPSEDLRRWLADTAARAFDGVPMFPHPLTPLARTWLGSIEVEDVLAQSLRQAMDRFAAWAQSQGAAQEELVTGALLMELETAFRNTSLRLESGGRKRMAQMISVSQRPVSKTEEKRWGCDIALLLNADIRPSVSLRLAELVQVKKSEAFAKRVSHSPGEKWRIDVPQLVTLLSMSESSSYWLILSSGEVLCLTARWIHGLVGGRNAFRQGGLTVGYNDVRHAAVPIEQFLPEIFLGTWIGSVHAKALNFANGFDSNLIPRHIFEISIVDQDGRR